MMEKSLADVKLILRELYLDGDLCPRDFGLHSLGGEYCELWEDGSFCRTCWAEGLLEKIDVKDEANKNE